MKKVMAKIDKTNILKECIVLEEREKTVNIEYIVKTIIADETLKGMYAPGEVLDIINRCWISKNDVVEVLE